MRPWAALALLAAPAAAQDEPRFCPNRPDLGASNCTTEPGRVLVELSAIDWTREDAGGVREGTLVLGDLLARFGVGRSSEVQVGFTVHGRVRTRDGATGVVETVSGPGDLRLALRRNLSGQDGGRFGLAVEPFVTVPVGRAPIGAGGWGAGVVLPVSYDLAAGWAALFTGEATVGGDAPASGSGGRRLGLGATFGLGRALSERVGAVAEIAVTRDDGPAALVTAASVAWQPRPGLQFDVLAVAGLNRAASDVQLQLGAAVLF